ncbi:PPR domain-containing protein, partial [Cephalotus follicularis]
SGFFRAGKIKECFELWEVIGKESCFAYVFRYEAVEEGLYKARNCKKALDIWGQILKYWLHPDISYNITLTGFCSCHRISGAIKFLYDTLNHGILPTAITWNIVVRAVLYDGPST